MRLFLLGLCLFLALCHCLAQVKSVDKPQDIHPQQQAYIDRIEEVKARVTAHFEDPFSRDTQPQRDRLHRLDWLTQRQQHPAQPKFLVEKHASESAHRSFANPAGQIAVAPHSTFTVFRNHTTGGEEAAGLWDFVTQIGSVPCDKVQGELDPQQDESSPLHTCTDSLVTLLDVSLVAHNDPTTDLFRYTFSTQGAGKTTVSFCYFSPWESCTGEAHSVEISIQAPAADQTITTRTWELN